jgi:hypothetical protein
VPKRNCFHKFAISRKVRKICCVIRILWVVTARFWILMAVIVTRTQRKSLIQTVCLLKIFQNISPIITNNILLSSGKHCQCQSCQWKIHKTGVSDRFSFPSVDWVGITGSGHDTNSCFHIFYKSAINVPIIVLFFCLGLPHNLMVFILSLCAVNSGSLFVNSCNNSNFCLCILFIIILYYIISDHQVHFCSDQLPSSQFYSWKVVFYTIR